MASLEASAASGYSRLRAPGDFRGRHSTGGRDSLGNSERAGPRSPLTRSGTLSRGNSFSFSTELLDSLSATPVDSTVSLSSSPTPGQGNIRVAVRVRPLPPTEEGIIEVDGTDAIAIRKDAATGGNEFLRSQQGRVEERTFDRVFGPEATQTEVYSWSCAPLVTDAVARARSATIFVYGATGAGKTHTMFGTGEREHQGLIFRAIPEVFDAIANFKSGCEVDGNLEVKVSFLEIYNEVLRDLLQEHRGGGTCKVLEDERKGVVKVANLLEAVVQSPEEALWHLKTGMQARTIEATAANSQSSRAHAVFTLTVEHVRTLRTGNGPFRRSNTEVRTVHSKISLIDLAGSERASLTLNSGSALKDGARINQSLLALANCIDALTAKGREGASTPRKKPPYRDSKLTLMLKASLTGDGLVAMIANVHPGRNHFEDSNNTLEYAKRASAVRCSIRARAARQSAGQASRQASIDEDVWLEEGCTMGSASSSSLLKPPPRLVAAAAAVASRDRERFRRHSDQKYELHDGDKAGKCDLTEATTASSHEECLSEISLESHLGLDHAAAVPVGICPNGSGASTNKVPPQRAPESTDLQQEQQDQIPEVTIDATMHTYFEGEEHCKGSPLSSPCVRSRPLASPCLRPSPGEDSTLGEKSINVESALKLLRESRGIEAKNAERIQSLTRERNALFQDRNFLEEELSRAQAAIVERDQTIEKLMSPSGGCHTL